MRYFQYDIIRFIQVFVTLNNSIFVLKLYRPWQCLIISLNFRKSDHIYEHAQWNHLSYIISSGTDNIHLERSKPLIGLNFCQYVLLLPWLFFLHFFCCTWHLFCIPTFFVHYLAHLMILRDVKTSFVIIYVIVLSST